ncbi:MAG: phosphotransferase, partial [Desulfobacteraceae bacterium]|nr:phosphotransferase [Desulfobacteraceae bacterium]
MYQWVDSSDEPCLPAACGGCAVSVRKACSGTPAGRVFRFAAALSEEARLCIDLISSEEEADPPSVTICAAPPGCRLEISAGKEIGHFCLCLTVPPSETPDRDDEVRVDIGGDVPPCLVVLRRTACRISTSLMDSPHSRESLLPQTRSALLWYGWNRFRDIVGLKRFTTGKSGSDVLVLRPRLRDPEPAHPLLRGSCIPGVISRAWGSCILVKTGKSEKMREEWDRFHTFLSDRMHPFMARAEAYLSIRTPGQPEDQRPLSTVIGSYLGGDLFKAESLEQAVCGPGEDCRAGKTVRNIFAVLAPWYEGSCVKPLGEWYKMFRFDEGRLLLFGKYDLTKKADMQSFARPLAWDVPFIKEEHLRFHLLGKNADGLLHLLKDMDVRFSLTHGDLHPRNILVDSENSWLLDFGETGVAPTLFDFAKLEVYLRLWCLDLTPGVADFETAATGFEQHLLDGMMKTEGGHEAVRKLAPSLGCSEQGLANTAACIVSIRREASRYCMGWPDNRDYIAVLFLTVMNTLRFAGEDPKRTENYRLLMSLFWLLEDILGSIVGIAPYPRGRLALDRTRLVGREWLSAAGAPERVLYLMNRPDGSDALEPLSATRGVLQSQNHHLDVFDHTLLVLAYIEDLLEDPIEGLLDPPALDYRVMKSLKAQGIRIPPPCSQLGSQDRPRSPLSDIQLDRLRKYFDRTLTGDSRLLLKWVALFHDVGKPATRTMNTGNKGAVERIRFLGHEVYGRQLVTDLAERLFADQKQKARFDRLLCRHHDHHNMVSRYIPAGELEKLKSTVKAMEQTIQEMNRKIADLEKKQAPASTAVTNQAVPATPPAAP